jgi:hypothetical protein
MHSHWQVGPMQRKITGSHKSQPHTQFSAVGEFYTRFHLLILNLIDDFSSYFDYTASNDRISEWWMEMDVEGNGRRIIYFPGICMEGGMKNATDLTQDSYFPGSDSKWQHPEYKARRSIVLQINRYTEAGLNGCAQLSSCVLIIRSQPRRYTKSSHLTLGLLPVCVCVCVCVCACRGGGGNRFMCGVEWDQQHTHENQISLNEIHGPISSPISNINMLYCIINIQFLLHTESIL